MRSAELVAAVRDVLAAAGLPLQPDVGALMGRVAALQEQLAAASSKAQEVRNKRAKSCLKCHFVCTQCTEWPVCSSQVLVYSAN